MNTLIIFGAKYLVIIAVAIAAVIFAVSLSRSEKKRMLLLAVISLPLVYIVAKICSHFFINPRPFVVGHFTPIVDHAPDNGFPSDHALLLSAVSTLFIFYRKQVAIVLWIITLLVAASRVAAGVHHWVDVLGSAVIALVVTWAVHALLKKYDK